MKTHVIRLSLAFSFLTTLATSPAWVLAAPSDIPQRAQAGARPSAAVTGTPLNALPATFKAPQAGAQAARDVKSTSPIAPPLPPLLRKTASPTAGPSSTDALQAPMLAHCATGFNKTAEHKQAQTGVLDSFECTTPVITCPKNPVLPLTSLEVQILSENPEGSVKRIRYICTYYPAVP